MSLRYPPRRKLRLPVLPILAVVAVVSLLGLAGFAFTQLPAVVAVSAEGTVRIGPRTPLEITFSQPMSDNAIEDWITLEPRIDGIWQAEDNIVRFIPLSEWPRNQAIQVTIRALAPSQSGLPLLQSRQWSFSVQAAQIVFLRPDAANHAQIYRIQPDGSDLTQITTTDFGVLAFAVHPTGGQLIYAVDRGDGGGDLYRYDITTNTSDLLLNCAPQSCRQPAIDPSGVLVAYEEHQRDPATGNYDPNTIRLFNLTTNAPQPLPLSGQRLHSPAWANSQQIAFVNEPLLQIGVYDLTTGQQINLPDNTNEQGSWHPIGPTLVYAQIAAPEVPLSQLPTNEPLIGTPEFTPTPTIRPTAAPGDVLSANLFIVNLRQPTPTPTRFTDLPQVEDTLPVISPNGQWVAFARKSLEFETWTPGRQLWVMRIDGSEARQLTDQPLFAHSGFAWSADSFTVVFVQFNVADFNQPPELWAIDLDGQNSRLLIVGATSPHWLP